MQLSGFVPISLHSQITHYLIWHQSLYHLSEPWHISFQDPSYKGQEVCLVARQTVLWLKDHKSCLTLTTGSDSIISSVSSSWSPEHTCVSNPLRLSLTVHQCRRECQRKSDAEHSQRLIIASRMKRYFDSHLYSDSSGPTSEIIRALSYTQNRQTAKPLNTQPFRYWIVPLVNYHPMPDQYTL